MLARKQTKKELQIISQLELHDIACEFADKVLENQPADVEEEFLIIVWQQAYKDIFTA